MGALAAVQELTKDSRAQSSGDPFLGEISLSGGWIVQLTGRFATPKAVNEE